MKSTKKHLIAGIITITSCIGLSAYGADSSFKGLNFENGLADWNIEKGKEFKNLIITTSDISNLKFEGKQWLDMTGTRKDKENIAILKKQEVILKSKSFVIDFDKLCFLMSGSHGTYIDLTLADNPDSIIKRACARKAISRRWWDVSKFKGQKVNIIICKKKNQEIAIDDIRIFRKDEFATLKKEHTDRDKQVEKIINDYKNIISKPVSTVLTEKIDSHTMPLGGIGSFSPFFFTGEGRFRYRANFSKNPPYLPTKNAGFFIKTGNNIVEYVATKMKAEYPMLFTESNQTIKDTKIEITAINPFIPLDHDLSVFPCAYFKIKITPHAGNINGDLIFKLPLKSLPKDLSNVPGKIIDVKTFKCLAFSENDNTGIGAIAFSENVIIDKNIISIPYSASKEKSFETTIMLAWHFKEHPVKLTSGDIFGKSKNLSITKPLMGIKFKNIEETLRLGVEHSKEIIENSSAFHDVVFDTTLPSFIVDRAANTAAVLSSPVSMMISDGRFYGYEGADASCPMNTTHVWQYAMTLDSLFPEIGITQQEITLKYEMGKDGSTKMRCNTPVRDLKGNVKTHHAADGHFGVILKVYQHHLRTKDNSFLAEYWEKIKLAMDFGINYYDIDQNNPTPDGIIERAQNNTYDSGVEGPNTFIGSFYLASLRACEEMAIIMGDKSLADKYQKIFLSGSKWMSENLWDENLGFFINKYPVTSKASNYGNGCVSDQMIGQWWARRLRLGPLFPEYKIKQTLKSIFKWNYVPAPTEETFANFYINGFNRQFYFNKPGLLVCNFRDSELPPKAMTYSSEMWTGIEYQVAGHSFMEGLIDEGLLIVYSIWDRYNYGKRNTFSEAECGSFYSRGLSSWGLIDALSGYYINAPKKIIEFNPQYKTNDFKSCFVAAGGWGSFKQLRDENTQNNTIAVQYGAVNVKMLRLGVPKDKEVNNVNIDLNGNDVAISFKKESDFVVITFNNDCRIQVAEKLNCKVNFK